MVNRSFSLNNKNTYKIYKFITEWKNGKNLCFVLQKVFFRLNNVFIDEKKTRISI